MKYTPRTPAERSMLLDQVKQRVAIRTPKQEAALQLRRAMAEAATATKH